MSKVTSKLQVTIRRRIAEQFSIKPGDEIDFVATAEGLRVRHYGSVRAVNPFLVASGRVSELPAMYAP